MIMTVPLTDLSPTDLVEAWARRLPDAVAVLFEKDHLTYGELDRRALRLARRLRHLGVRDEARVGLCTRRSVDLIVGLLGIWKAGGAYVPLDPDHPAERRALMLEDSGASVLVTHRGLVRGLPDPEIEVVDLDDLDDWAEPLLASGRGEPFRPDLDHLAYVMFTSGSTGRPKGVQITHRCLGHRLRTTLRQLDIRDGEVWTVVHAYTFDFSVWEIWACLASGGRLVIVPQAVARDPALFHDLLAAERVDILTLTPSALRQLTRVWEGGERDPRELPVRQVICGGEALPSDFIRPLLGLGPKIWNLYGPTEVTIFVTFHPAVPEDLAGESMPVGRAFPDTEIRVLDAALQPVPPGKPGELCILGTQDMGLARGYLGRPDLTAERFMPDPEPSAPGTRLYRTGDLGRWRSDGILECLGRMDHQIKIRGFRAELGEIEAVLATHPGLRQAAVTLHRAAPEDRLVAYVVPSGSELPQVTDLLGWLRQRLPEYMIPAAFIPMDALPVTPHGKVDRAALPAPESVRLQAAAPFLEGPRTPVEETLTQIFADLLGLERVGIHDNFFNLGGHSLLATQLASRANRAFGVELPVANVFESPTCAALAGLIDGLIGAQRALARPIEPVAAALRQGGLPLSFAQERLWFLDQLQPGSSFYNVPLRITLRGELSAGLLEPVLAESVRRHEILRTTFTEGTDGPVQVVAPEVGWSLPQVDLSALPDSREEAERLAREEALRPFHLARGPLLRGTLLRLGAREHQILLNLHHIIFDGWSIGVLLREMRQVYTALLAGRAPALPPLPIQYGDFAVWQRSWMSGEVLDAELTHWLGRLAHHPGVLELPADRPRPAVQTFRGAVARMAPGDLDARPEDRLTALARRQGVTLFMLLFAAFLVLLRRITEQEDLVVGTPIANRNREEIEGLAGFFINTLALRTDLSGEPTFSDLLGRVRETALAAYAHQDLPFERLIQELSLDRDPGRSPLLQVLFLVQNTLEYEPELAPGVDLEVEELFFANSKFDLTLGFQLDKGGALVGGAEYSTALFDEVTVQRLLSHLGELLRSAVANPEQPISSLSLMNEAQRHQVLTEWNDAQAEFDRSSCIHEFFEAWAERRPDEEAVLFGDRSLTYRELEAEANRLAHVLRGVGVGPEVRVGLCLERSPEMVIGILGILKAGGAYVPLDPAYPRERLDFMAEDSRMPVLVTQDRLAGLLPLAGREVILLDAGRERLEAASPARPASGVRPENLAYVIYTSGSTGRPKGVLVEHRQAANLAADTQIEAFRLAPGARVLQFASLSFDSSVADLLMAFRAGATLCLAPQESLMPGPPLLDLLRRQGITNVTLPPSVLAALGSVELKSLRTIISGGEACPAELVDRWAPGRRFYNTYGPSETTVCSTATLCHPGTGTPSLGRPITNTAIHLLDRRLEAVPIGIPGELYIGGAGVTRGYLGRPELAAERFVPDPFGSEPGARLYRTGDLARRRRDGELEFLGRVDFQVKLRGFRIELEEVESALLRLPGALQSAALVREDVPGDRRLVGYLVPEPGVDLEPAAVRALLQQSLPEHMVPSILVLLEALPLSPNGKLNRRALPAPDRDRAAAGAYVPPRTPIEQILADLWADLLGVERVGAFDNFFDLGGHSLLATRMVSRLSRQFEIDVPVRAVFEHPNVAALAELIERLLIAEIDSLTDEEALGHFLASP